MSKPLLNPVNTAHVNTPVAQMSTRGAGLRRRFGRHRDAAARCRMVPRPQGAARTRHRKGTHDGYDAQAGSGRHCDGGGPGRPCAHNREGAGQRCPARVGLRVRHRGVRRRRRRRHRSAQGRRGGQEGPVHRRQLRPGRACHRLGRLGALRRRHAGAEGPRSRGLTRAVLPRPHQPRSARLALQRPRHRARGGRQPRRGLGLDARAGHEGEHRLPRPGAGQELPRGRR